MARSLRVPFFSALVLLAACGGPAPRPQTTPAETPVHTSVEEPSAGVVRVTSNGLNVRRDPSMDGEILAQAKKGEALKLLASTGSWSKVQLDDGTVGWVATRFVTRDSVPDRAAPRRRGCAADADFRFVVPPKPRFSDSQGHGLVSVDVTVDANGKITSTRVVSNSTGDDALARLAVDEIRSASFSPPVRNCAPRAFIYTYKRSF